MLTKTVIRYVSAVVSVAVATVYLLIAFGVISVVSTAPQSGDWVIPGSAGVAFAALALLLVTTKNRIVPIVGAAMSILTIAGYFVVAPHRTPSFETWGLLIKLAQGVLVVGLGYLGLGSAESAARRQVT